jgi:two-component system phosphate regulon response regulator PhoB
MNLASILVIDSDPLIRARIARELRDLGYVVQESTGAEVKALPDNIVSKGETVSGGGITIDNAGHRVSVDGHYIALAPREYRLLLFLLNNTDRVFSRKQLLIHVWDRDATVGPRTVDVHIRRLRSTLEPFGYDRYLQTLRGTGYRFSLDT